MALFVTGKGKLILAPNPTAPKRIQVTPHQLSSYFNAVKKHHPYPLSRAAWYHLRLPSPEKIFNHSMPALVGIGTRRLQIIIASWNVQGLRTPGKYDQILAFMIKHKIDILLMQETWQTTSSHFQKTTPTSPPPHLSDLSLRLQ